MQDASTVDSTTGGGDAGGDADAVAPPAPLRLCGLFDTDFGLHEGDASPDMAAYDRTQWWAGAINTNFIVAESTDCRIADMVNTALSPDEQNQYANDVNGWVEQLFGCGPAADGGALTYGLIPSPLASSHVFSTADLKLLNDLYLQAIVDTLSCGGGCPPYDGLNAGSAPNFPTLPPLTTDQTNAVKAQLTYLAGTVTGTVKSTTYTYFDSSLCPPDAGPEAGAVDGATDAPADAGADASHDAATQGG